MSRRFGTQLPELRQVVFRDVVARQMEHRVLEGAGVAVAQDESVAVDPGRVLAGIFHRRRPQQVGHRGAPHRRAGVAAVGRLGLVGRNGTDRVDAQQLEVLADIGHDNICSID